jgi:rhamnosyltransferase
MEGADPKYRSDAGSLARPKVLVLLAAYNGAKWIGEQIQSVLAQTGVDVHLVIRDDGSSDSTRSEIERFTAVDSRVELIAAPAPSRSASQNFFFLIRSGDASNFDFVALSDQDDVWDRQKLRQATDSLARSRASGYSSAVTAIWPTGASRRLTQNPFLTESDYLFEGAGQGCTFVLASEFYNQLRRFLQAHEHLTQRVHFHDWVIYALSRAWHLDWVFDSISTMQYRQHGNNDTGARAGLRGVATRMARIRKGWYADQLLGISDLCQAAKPDNSLVHAWHTLLRTDRTFGRRLMIAQFCLRGGRRRKSDNAILVLAALFGWI